MLRSEFQSNDLSSDHEIVALERSQTSDLWVDLDAQQNEVPLSPQPPSMCDRVFKVKTLQSTDNLIGLLHVATQNPVSSHNQTGWSTSAELLRQFRFLILNNSHGTLASQVQPSTALISLALRDSDTTSGISTHSKGRVSNHTRWIPHTLAYGGFAISSGPRILARIVEQSTSRSNDGYFYIAADLAKDGEGSLSYPQPPEQTGPPENLLITGLGLSTSFTLLVAGIMPEDDWNHLTPRGTSNPKYWPLFTLWGDSNNWIEFGAYATGHTSGSNHIEDGWFRVRYKANGGSVQNIDWPVDHPTNPVERQDIYWSRNSQLLVDISYDTSVSPPVLRVLASLGGEAPRARTAGPVSISPAFSTSFGTLKFQGADDEVVTFRWFGGQAVHDDAMTVAEMADQFKSLDFLSP